MEQQIGTDFVDRQITQLIQQKQRLRSRGAWEPEGTTRRNTLQEITLRKSFNDNHGTAPRQGD
jgi:hypothetical protein